MKPDEVEQKQSYSFVIINIHFKYIIYPDCRIKSHEIIRKHLYDHNHDNIIRPKNVLCLYKRRFVVVFHQCLVYKNDAYMWHNYYNYILHVSLLFVVFSFSFEVQTTSLLFIFLLMQQNQLVNIIRWLVFYV